MFLSFQYISLKQHLTNRLKLQNKPRRKLVENQNGEMEKISVRSDSSLGLYNAKTLVMLTFMASPYRRNIPISSRFAQV